MDKIKGAIYGLLLGDVYGSGYNYKKFFDGNLKVNGECVYNRFTNLKRRPKYKLSYVATSFLHLLFHIQNGSYDEDEMIKTYCDMVKKMPTYYNLKYLFSGGIVNYVYRRRVHNVVDSFENIVKNLAFIFYPNGDIVNMLDYLRLECVLITHGEVEKEIALCEELVIFGTSIIHDNVYNYLSDIKEINMVSSICECNSPNDDNFQDGAYIAMYSYRSMLDLKNVFKWIIKNRFGDIASRCAIAGFFFGLKYGYDCLIDFEEDIKKINEINDLEYLDSLILWLYCSI